jgi:signal transduction histidine kinase
MHIESTSDSVEILVVEDSPTQAQRLQHILVRCGYKVTLASNGVEALETMRSRLPTLIISDVVMPQMDGYELCRHVKSDRRLRHLPVILVTAISDPGDVIRGLECRADNFVLKPYDERYLLGRVQFVLLNREMEHNQITAMGVEIFFNGQRHFITADRLQILNLLLSTYDAAIQRNRELALAQEELNRSNLRLKSANEELESFSYSVSHDLRAPLRHIHGYVGLLKKLAAEQLPDAGRRYLENISSATTEMGRLIDDLLAFSRMGRAEMINTPIRLDAMVQEVIQSLEMAIQGRNIVWKIAPLPRVEGDPSMLKQVLVNLISNALKYSRQRDPAIIEIGFGGEEDGRAIIFVRDNGAGFDMQYADKLFGVFQRLHRADEFEGTGIGLATVRRIIDRHGGRTWAEGVLNQGAVFYFTLKSGSGLASEVKPANDTSRSNGHTKENSAC